jgi:hypothetical protein
VVDWNNLYAYAGVGITLLALAGWLLSRYERPAERFAVDFFALDLLALDFFDPAFFAPAFFADDLREDERDEAEREDELRELERDEDRVAAGTARATSVLSSLVASPISGPPHISSAVSVVSGDSLHEPAVDVSSDVSPVPLQSSSVIN